MKNSCSLNLLALVIRLVGSILCGILLTEITLGNFDTGCDCKLVVLLYFLISFCAFIVSYFDHVQIIMDILSIIISIILALVAIKTGHLICSGFIFVINLAAIIANIIIEADQN